MIKKYRINVHSLDENDGSIWSAFYFKEDADAMLKKLNNNNQGYTFSLEIIPVYTVTETRWGETDNYSFETLEEAWNFYKDLNHKEFCDWGYFQIIRTKAVLIDGEEYVNEKILASRTPR